MFLRAASAALLDEVDRGNTLRDLALNRVAKIAGVSGPAARRRWASQELFLPDALAHALRTADTKAYADNLTAIVRPLIRSGAPLTEVIRIAALQTFETFRDDPYWLHFVGLWSAYRTPEVRAALNEYYEAFTYHVTDVYEWVFATYRRQPRPPLGTQDIVAAINAAGDGLALRWAVIPDTVRDDIPRANHKGQPQRWNQYGIAAEAIINELTEPVPDDSTVADTPQRPPAPIASKPDDPVRTQLLDTAAAIAFDERTPAISPAILTVRELAERVGVAPSAFYQIWPTTADFEADLLADVLLTNAPDYIAEVRDAIGEPMEQGAGLEELLRVGARTNLDSLTDEDSQRVLLAFWPRHTTDPRIRNAITNHYRHYYDKILPLYQEIVTRFELHLQPWSEIGDIASIFGALADGLSMRRTVDPDSVPLDLAWAGDDSGWDLFSVSCLAVMRSLTTNTAA